MGQPVAGLQRNPDRQAGDFYPTHPSHIQALVAHLGDRLLHQMVWEPAAGDGAILDHLRTRIGTDLQPRHRLVSQRDFLHDEPLPHIDWIITNPPFSLFTEFVLRAIPLAKTALLMPVHFLGGQKRRDQVWQPHPPSEILVLAARRNRSQFNHAWAIWDGEGPTKTYWI